MKSNSNRVGIIDEVRGLSIIGVVVYHFFYTASVIFNLPWFIKYFPYLNVIQPILPVAFIILSGISCNFSSNNTKRGFLLLELAIAITLITAIFIPSQVIWFGIIHFLAVAILFFSQTEKILKKIPFWLGMLLSAVFYIATMNISKGYIGINPFTLKVPEIFYNTDILMMLGTHSKNFSSADYIPVLPMIFLFTFSLFAGRHIRKLPDFIKKIHIKPLAFIGRHTLIIYILHQPIIYGLLYLLTTLF